MMSKFNTIMIAHVQKKHLETAYVMEFELRTLIPNFKFRVFSEKENAINWLNHSFSDAPTS